MAGFENGYDIIVINYRGLAGAPLDTPQLFCSYSHEDMLEPIKFYSQKYCQNRKVFAVGCSMGANILANLIGNEGDDCMLEAACIVQAPIKMWECERQLREELFGQYDVRLGQRVSEIALSHENVLQEHFKETLGVDMKETLKNQKPPSLLMFDDVFTARAFGYKDR
jgi:predicted alpha/beta-fold hydrolase